LIVEAEQEVDKLYREALALAQADANASREKARREIEQQRDQALASLAAESDRLGTLIVDRLLAA
jgi:F-type H+-transporting ATPase subunit b